MMSKEVFDVHPAAGGQQAILSETVGLLAAKR